MADVARSQTQETLDAGDGREPSERTGEGVASLRTVLSLKREIPEKLEQRIQKQTKTEILEQWLKIAVEAPDVDTFEAKIMTRTN